MIGLLGLVCEWGAFFGGIEGRGCGIVVTAKAGTLIYFCCYCGIAHDTPPCLRARIASAGFLNVLYVCSFVGWDE